MPRGELVGEAYIRVTTDTTAGRRNLHRDARAMGVEFSSEFGKEVEASIEARMAGARKKIANALANIDFSDFEKRFGSVSAAVQNMEEAFEDLRKEGEITNDEFKLFTVTLRRWADDASVQERARKDAEALKALSAEVNRAHAVALRMNRDFDKSVLEEAMRDAAVEAARFNDELKKTSTIRFGNNITEAAVSMEKLRQGLRGADALIFKSARSSDDLDGGLRRSARSGSALFSVFGGVSKSLEGMAHRGNPLVDLFVAPLRAGASLGKLVEGTLMKAFVRLGLAGRAAIGPQFLAVLAGMAVAMAAAAKTASLFASALSLVAGMATIAASAIGGALVGALLLAAGTVPAIVAGLGGMILFFSEFEEKAPRATAAAKKFGEEFRKAFDERAFRGMDAAITTTLSKLRPLSDAFAKGLGDAMNKGLGTFIALLNDPRMKAGLDSLLTIPGQVNRLLNIAANAAFGALGVFRALSPFITRFLDQVSLLTIRFNMWANSAEGQRKLTQVFGALIDQAGKLMTVVSNLGKILGSIWQAATEGGTAGKFLDFLVQITTKFSNFLASTEGQNKLKAWFDDAFRAGQALGTLIQGIGSIFGALDTSKSREQVIKLTDGIGNFLNRSAPALEAFLGFIDGIGTQMAKIDFGPFLELGGFIVRVVQDMANALGDDALAALDAKLDGFNTLGQTIRNDLLPALEDMWEIMQPVWEFLGSAGFKNAVTGFQGVADAVDGAVTALSGFVNLIAGLVTLDGEKIKKGFEQIFEGAGEAAIGAFNIGLSSGGTVGLGDKIFGTDSLNFDETKKSVEGFFDGIDEATSNFDNTIGDTISGFFSDLGQKFTDTRLAIGGFFSGLFEGFNGEGLLTSVETALDSAATAVVNWGSGIITNIETSMDTAAAAVGTFFTETLPIQLENMRLAVGQFFSDLPMNIASALGTATGFLVAFFVSQWTSVFTHFTEVVLPWFAGLPGQIEAILDTATASVAGWFTEQWNKIFAYFETVAIPWIVAIPGRIEAALDTATATIATWFSDQWNSVFAYFETVAIPWVTGLPGRIEEELDKATDAVVNWFKDMWDKVTVWWDETAIPWVKGIPESVENALDTGSQFLVDWFKGAFENLKAWFAGTFFPFINGLPGRVQTAFVSLGIRVGGAIASHLKGVINGIIAQINQFISSFNTFSPFDLSPLRYLARGGEVTSPTMAMLGEGGKRELVIPMERPLSQIDASVRGLAAIAQGKAPATVNSVPARALVIEEGAIQVTSPFSDPNLVAQSLLDSIPEEVFG